MEASGVIDIGRFFEEEEAGRVDQLRQVLNRNGVQLIAQQEWKVYKALQVKAGELLCQVVRLETLNKTLTEELNREKASTKESIATQTDATFQAMLDSEQTEVPPSDPDRLPIFAVVRQDLEEPSPLGSTIELAETPQVPASNNGVEISLSEERGSLNRLVELDSGTTATPPGPAAENTVSQNPKLSKAGLILEQAEVPPYDPGPHATQIVVNQDLEGPSLQGSTIGQSNTPSVRGSNIEVSLVVAPSSNNKNIIEEHDGQMYPGANLRRPDSSAPLTARKRPHLSESSDYGAQNPPISSSSGVINPEQPAVKEAPPTSQAGRVSVETQVSVAGRAAVPPSNNENPAVEGDDQIESGENLRRPDSLAPPSSTPKARNRRRPCRLISESDFEAQNPPVSSSIRVDSTVPAGIRYVDRSERPRISRKRKSPSTKTTVNGNLGYSVDQTGSYTPRNYFVLPRQGDKTLSKKFKCQEESCGEAFYVLSQLNFHRLFKHGLRSVPGENQGCFFCGRIFKTLNQRLAHMKDRCTDKVTNKGPRSQPKPFKLKEVVLLLNRVDDSQRHEMAPGSSSNPDRCVCGRSFPSRETLEAHVQRPY